MQQIVYRELPAITDWKDADPPAWPTAEHVGGLCAMMQTWAQENGWRISSVTPVAGIRRRFFNMETMPVHTVGLVFVCDKL
jgi:hypothetical protein